MKKLTEDEHDQLAIDAAQALAQICMKWRGHEQQIARALAGTLGAFVSIHSADPEAALNFVAAAIRNTDHRGIRAAHFGAATLGNDGSVQLERPRPVTAVLIGTNQGRKPNE